MKNFFSVIKLPHPIRLFFCGSAPEEIACVLGYFGPYREGFVAAQGSKARVIESPIEEMNYGAAKCCSASCARRFENCPRLWCDSFTARPEPVDDSKWCNHGIDILRWKNPAHPFMSDARAQAANWQYFPGTPKLFAVWNSKRELTEGNV